MQQGADEPPEPRVSAYLTTYEDILLERQSLGGESGRELCRGRETCCALLLPLLPIPFCYICVSVRMLLLQLLNFLCMRVAKVGGGGGVGRGGRRRLESVAWGVC